MVGTTAIRHPEAITIGVMGAVTTEVLIGMGDMTEAMVEAMTELGDLLLHSHNAQSTKSSRDPRVIASRPNSFTLAIYRMLFEMKMVIVVETWIFFKLR
jgi:hypothetical protein